MQCVCVCVLVYSLTRSRASELTMCYTQLKIAHRTCIYIDPVFAYQKISIELNWNLRNLIKNLL